MDNIQERLDFIEFRQELLYNNSKFDRFLFEYEVTRQQLRDLNNLFESLKTEVISGENVNSPEYESEVYRIIPQHDGNYSFAENLAKLHHEQGSYEEVFEALYGDDLKFQTYFEQHNNW